MRSRYLPVAVATSILVAGCSLLTSCVQRQQPESVEIRVAVASNFAAPMKQLRSRFEADSPYRVTLMIGSTGMHFAQIMNGAPFDLFFAADSLRPQLLEQNNRAVAGSRFTYAIGKLVLWSPIDGYVQSDGEPLVPRDCRHLALANPRLAPYGKAAEEVLRARGMWETLSSRFVRGDSIGQTFQFVRSGNAEAGFVAYSQLKRPDSAIEGSLWVVPEELYSPLEQQAVLLQDHEGARAFLEFVHSEAAQEILRDYGYGTP